MRHEQIEKFTLKTKVTQKDFGERWGNNRDEGRDFNSYTTGVDESYLSIFETKKMLRSLDVELDGLKHFARVFEFPELTDEANTIVAAMHADLNTILQLWHL
eukprot:323823-Hanusia_phi.AAC.1